MLALVRATTGTVPFTLPTVSAREQLARGVAAALGCELALFAPAVVSWLAALPAPVAAR